MLATSPEVHASPVTSMVMSDVPKPMLAVTVLSYPTENDRPLGASCVVRSPSSLLNMVSFEPSSVNFMKLRWPSRMSMQSSEHVSSGVDSLVVLGEILNDSTSSVVMTR